MKLKAKSLGGLCQNVPGGKGLSVVGVDWRGESSMVVKAEGRAKDTERSSESKIKTRILPFMPDKICENLWLLRCDL